MVRVVLATHNRHKALEFQQILGDAVPGLEIVGYDGPEPVEDGVTFEANALIKARAAAAHTGLPALADDSGICVDAMGGAPGIFSARWAGRHGDAQANLQLLLDQLADLPDGTRAAHFTATLALVSPAGETVVEGIWPGSIAHEPRGEHGHGYDPIFVPDGHDATAAELGPEVKNAESHRSRAFTAIVPALRDLVAAAG
ncbi:RdgB/HAM1 family non-canonical purine NTP pyrophosphatase [Leifsonia shinshuensis]|uniref:dITP/XTP pyrophosphatase n=1 Tax=Leifsonia shinshuensis TaxID=150026 RepID=A0A7G6Y830_9MICO|nr:RdgB/HAM1 family non-canonical purine NTP pyrophosphatase [Leifsonia shinshuensis]QNE34645.1 RdgB/HAM1 family non-canonical purine NTP pyrophosphatase [Leifsonia shinshuensis]